MKYYLYKCDVLDEKISFQNNSSNFNIDFLKISPLNLFIKNEKKSFKDAILRLYFWFSSYGKVYIYYVEDNEQIVHTSYVMKKSYKFPFMKKDDFEVGPCFTISEYRGKGIYPSVINKIKHDMLTEKNRIYMIVRRDNKSSIKGIEKSGFTKMGMVIKKGKKYIRVS